MALIAWYKLDGNANDSSGNGYNGTPTNMSWVSGKIGQAGSFNGSGSYVNCSNNAIFNLKNTFTLSCWVNPSQQTTQYNGVISKTSGNTAGYELRTTNTDINSTIIQLRVMNGSDLKLDVTVSNNVWSLITAVFNNGNATIFVNGIATSFGTLATESAIVSNDLFIGKLSYANLYYKGYIDDVRIYSHALSLKEVKELSKAKMLHYTCDTSNVFDVSGYKNDGISANVALNTTTYKLGQGSYTFNGIDSYINIGDVARLNNGGTISCWYYAKSAGEASAGRLIDKSTNTDVTNGYMINLVGSNAIALRINTAANSVTAATTLNAWHHIVAVISSTKKELWLDGVKNENLTDTSLPPNVAGNVYIGNRADNTDRTFDGYIDDFRIYNTILNDADILELYKTRIQIDDKGNVLAPVLKEYNVTEQAAYATGIFEEQKFNEGALTQGLLAWYPLNGNAKDLAGRKDGTVSGATIVAGLDSKLCYSFNKINNNSIDLGSTIHYSGSQTWCGWMKSANTASGNAVVANDYGNYRGPMLITLATTGYAFFSVSGTGSDQFAAQSSTSVCDGSWHHLIGVYDSSLLCVKLYVDNILVQTTTSVPSSIYVNTYNTYIGRRPPTQSYYMDGLIQDVRIYNRALSDSEINTLYKLTGGSLTAKDQMTSTTLYTKGIFKEVYN